MATWLTQFRSAPHFEERYRALQAIIRDLPADQAAAAVRDGLDDADSAVRAGSARWLATQAGQPVRPGSEELWNSIAACWQKLLTDADPDVRFESARGLVHLNAEISSAAAVLSELLCEHDTHPSMIAAILGLLASIRPGVGISAPAWATFLNHEHAAVREAAARALGRWGKDSQDLACELAMLVEDEEPFVREEAARSLGLIDVSDPEVLAALQSAAADDDQVVAEAAKASLRQLQS